MITDIVMAASSDEGAPLWVLAAGPVGAVATYWSIWRYYRNTDKSHSYDHETLVEAKPVQGREEKIDHIRKTRKTEIKGKNTANHRSRVHRLH